MKSKIEKAAAEDDVTQEAEDKQTMEIDLCARLAPNYMCHINNCTMPIIFAKVKATNL